MIQVVFPSSLPSENDYLLKKEHLISKNIYLNCPDLEKHTKEQKASILQQALDIDQNIIYCGRGGYGASDLLSLIDFRTIKAKALIGYSDACSLFSYFYTKKVSTELIHAPMPFTPQYQPEDYHSVLEVLKNTSQYAHKLIPLNQNPNPKISGLIFGGCFSVLTCLIGTPFFPDLTNHILLFEDVNENEGRLFRMLNQWIYSKVLLNVKAIIWGDLCVGTDELELKKRLSQHLGKNIPCFSADFFGHGNKNLPFKLSTHAIIQENTLSF
jgi:muramoyltetrapeptide carboxypeptidase